MRIAIFSDIHGNREALKSIINDIKKEGIQEIICLGDTIGLGPNSGDCLDILIDNNVKMVLGNHDLYYLKGTIIDDEMGESEIEHHHWVDKQITDRHKKYLENCGMTIEREYNGRKVLFEHFLIDYSSNDLYPFYDLKIIKDGRINDIAKSSDYDLIFIGHEHRDFVVDKIYDVGSSGCSKDDNTKYTIFDTDTFSIETKNLKYDRDSFVKELLKEDYPDREFISGLFFGVDIHNYGGKSLN